MRFIAALLSLWISGAPYAWAQNPPAPKLSAERVILHTDLGDISLAFYPEIAPKHVAQILKLVELGVYDGTEIFRIEPRFVAQIENYDAKKVPLTPAQREAVAKLPAEFSSIPHVRGTLSMARFDDPNSAESSFSLLLGEAPHLDGKYTVFGQVAGGWEAFEAIERVSVDEHFRPKVPLQIQHAEVIRDGSYPDQAPPKHGQGIAIGLVALFVAMLAWALFPRRSEPPPA